MSTPRITLLGLFSDEDEAFLDEPETEAGRRLVQQRQAAQERAAWCLLTGQPFETYNGLSRTEREAFLDAAKRMRG